MRKLIALAALTIQAGATLGLTAKQAADRGHALKPLKVEGAPAGSAAYEVVSPVQFKAGETFYCDADLNKGLASLVEDEESQRKKKKA